MSTWANLSRTPLYFTARWVALALLAAGCGADAMDASSPTQSGGQTGSLVPPTCEEAASNPFVVPEGKTAFVETWHELSNPVLEDTSGNAIAVSLTQDTDASVVRTAQPLPAGDYTLTYDCGAFKAPIQRTVSISAAAPLPTAFGELELVAPSRLVECSALEFITLAWIPPDEFLPYLDLVQLSFWIGGVELGVVPLTKPLSSDVSGAVLIEIPHCDHFQGTCAFLPATYTLRAEVSGHTEQWVSPEVEVDGLCFRAAKRSQTEDIGCALRNPRQSFDGEVIGWMLAGCLVLRRAKRRVAESAS